MAVPRPASLANPELSRPDTLARLILGANPQQRVRYLDGNPLNLRGRTVLRSGLFQAADQEESAMVQAAARRVTAKDTNEKPAHRRATVLELAERLGMSLGPVVLRDRPDQLLRLEAALADARAGGHEGPAADRQEPSDDHASRGDGADRGAGAHASGLWVQPDPGVVGPEGPPCLGDHPCRRS